jgi:hypothetical protein
MTFRQPSYTTWSHRGLRHRLLIIRGHRTGVGSRPRIADRLAACGLDPELWGHGPYWLGWPLSQGHRHGSHPVVGGIVHVSSGRIWTVGHRTDRHRLAVLSCLRCVA